MIGLGAKAKFPSLNSDEILASVSYTPLGGDPDGLGDGIIPWRIGIMVCVQHVTCMRANP